VPRYDYRCSVCGHEVELLRGIHDPGPRVCPNCGAEGSMRKEFATPAVHYKGSGWAKKDRSTASSSRSAASSSSKDGSKDGSNDGSGSSSSHDESGDGGTVTSATEASSTGDAKKAETSKGSTPKPSSDRGAA
jgi:putative FmdB family regulatory protein